MFSDRYEADGGYRVLGVGAERRVECAARPRIVDTCVYREPELLIIQGAGDQGVGVKGNKGDVDLRGERK